MADNQGQTIVAPVNTQPALAQNPQTYPNPAQPPAPAHQTFEVPQEQLGPQPPSNGSRGGFVQRLRTPVAAAVIAGALLLGVGFATGYVVGHDRGSASVSSSTDGQTGFGGGMPGGQMPGGQMPGGQTGQGQTGQGQTGQGGAGQDLSGSGTLPFGSGQSQDGTTQDGTTLNGTTQDGTDLTQTQ